jgi:fatty-acyl-CoA synthase
MFGLMQDWPLRLHRILDHAAAQFPDEVVISRLDDGSCSRISYATLWSRARRVARRLLQDGIRPGDRVGTMAWNGAAHMEAWFGIAGCGAVYHTINPRLFVEQILWIIGHAADRALFVEVMFLPLVEQLVDRLPSLERVIVLGTVSSPAPALPGLVGYEAWLAEADGEEAWREGDEREAAGLCYTSGTTGEPKGVLYSHRSTVLHALSIVTPNSMGIGLRDVVMPIVPMFHVNAWGLPFAAPMMGARLVMPGAKLDGASLHDLMEAEGVTMAAGVPTVWMGLLDHLRRHDRRLSSLRRLFTGGSACPPSLIAAFERDYGIEVCHAWGMTETSPVASACGVKRSCGALDEGERLALKQSQGFAPFGIEMKIVDDAGCALPWDGIAFGRLAVRGGTVASAYFEDGTPILDDEGFFDTGDVATIDPRGYTRIVDRTKDVIKSGGEWISSIAIENLALCHPGVAEAAVIGVPHPKWDERPILILVGREAAPPGRAEMMAFLAGKIARWWMPDDVVAIEAMPHTATGKTSKKTLRAMFKDFRLAGDEGG